jgi:DNA-binding response OmpR family regulator
MSANPLARAAPRRILIVEDHPQICELITLTLAPLQADISVTACAEKGLEMALEQRPDVVILDVQLAGRLNGFDVCRRIKADADLSHLRVVIVTTQSQTSAMDECVAVCADAFLRKPFSPTELLSAVRQLLA